MRIGLFTDTYAPQINGVATSILMLEHSLRKLGHEVYVVTVNNDILSYDFGEANIIRIPGIPTGIYDYRLSGIYPLKAINKIKKWNLDIIHSHTEFGIGTFARIMAKQLDIPIVHTYHTMYEDYVHYITKGHFDTTSKKIVEYFTKFYCDKTVTELIVPTKKTYDLFKEKYKYDRNIHIIPTGIEVERFYKENVDFNKVNALKEKYKIAKDDFVILFVGRIAQEKSIDFLIDNHAYLMRRNKNCKLLIVGAGPDLEILKKKAKRYGNNIVFTGKVPWEDVPNYYHIASCFATASHTETQGLTVIEAMAAGIPVVALDDESFNTVIKEGLDGYLFKDKKKYRNSIVTLMSDKEKCMNMGRHALVSSDAYSSKYYASRVLDVYKLALKGRDPGKKRGFFAKAKDVVKRGLHGK